MQGNEIERGTRPEEMYRNPMTTRWNDADFKLVADEAWRRRLSVSELVRRLVLEGLRAEAAAGTGTGVEKQG
jgi:hypothetical protein